jgi:hypothetical protein
VADAIRTLVIGPEHPVSWWDEHTPKGDCEMCGGDCDGDDCGLHAAGCVFGGFSYGYWMFDPECPRFHGEADRDE